MIAVLSAINHDMYLVNLKRKTSCKKDADHVVALDRGLLPLVSQDQKNEQVSER
jgi:hypothetical protein